MATEMAEVSNRVNFGSWVGRLTCPEKSGQREYPMISGLVQKKRYGIQCPENIGPASTWWTRCWVRSLSNHHPIQGEKLNFWSTRPKTDIPYMIYTKFHSPRLIFFSPSSKALVLLACGRALVSLTAIKDRAHLLVFKFFIFEKFSCFIVLVVIFCYFPIIRIDLCDFMKKWHFFSKFY